ncbi:hypothetical protein DIS24_g10287 [Lasiodiplodia hormozganensis]|uniref:Protein kinase domain-containing protein n=1 Tax=Lasiodiplodia hormozganensis TaxID=869390 RepID=A0AA40CGV6_9PEZI|nr:hypothetical protein DIS24_g10287 [Lasiodiplodia hormozganensis]
MLSLQDREQKVAIKRLHSGDKKDFEKERSIYVTLGKKQDVSPHLAKLLATYEYQGKFHFIFPRANCNLRKYWENNPRPSFTRKTFLWSLKQMTGIATALDNIHNFRTTVPLDGKGRTPTGDVQFSVKDGEELFGRHGDIKPENILWFEHIPQHQRRHSNPDSDDSEGGILQITDFGLGRFHGRDSGTEGTFRSQTYEPPEYELHRPVSRLYDIWSLGCLYLEFATWLLKGYDAIEDFSDHRACPSSIDPQLSDDFFFKVVRDEHNIINAVVHDGVKDWANMLHTDKKCPEFIHDIVDLVMEELLLIDAKDRIKTPWLCVKLKGFLEKAETDPAYLCGSAGRRKWGIFRIPRDYYAGRRSANTEQKPERTLRRQMSW